MPVPFCEECACIGHDFDILPMQHGATLHASARLARRSPIEGAISSANTANEATICRTAAVYPSQNLKSSAAKRALSPFFTVTSAGRVL